MKKYTLVVSLVGLLCLLLPAAAHAGAPQYRQVANPKGTAALRHTAKPRHDQVHRGGVDGSLTLIQFISTRRAHKLDHQDEATPQGSVAQVRASAENAEPRSPATFVARAVESLPPHRGATHLSL